VAPRGSATDPSRVDAEHEGQVGEALVRFSVRNVPCPKPIRRGSGEVPTDEVQSGCGRGGRRRLKSFVVPRRFYDSAAELRQAVLSALRLLRGSRASVLAWRHLGTVASLLCCGLKEVEA
jgi:hypothetical protein